jgi:hypothetical protein
LDLESRVAQSGQPVAVPGQPTACEARPPIHGKSGTDSPPLAMLVVTLTEMARFGTPAHHLHRPQLLVAVGSPSVTQAPAWRPIAVTSPNWMKMHSLTRRGGAPRTEMQSQPWAACRIYEPLSRPCPGGFGCLRPRSIRCEMLWIFWMILALWIFRLQASGLCTCWPGSALRSASCGPAAAGGPPRTTDLAQARSCFWNRGASWQALVGQLRDGAGDQGLEHASRQLEYVRPYPPRLACPCRRAISALSPSTSSGSSIASITDGYFLGRRCGQRQPHRLSSTRQLTRSECLCSTLSALARGLRAVKKPHTAVAAWMRPPERTWPSTWARLYPSRSTQHCWC